ncbi:MAG TPA: MaoC family dehydratase N-terminal domain-containing protein [Acidimicrobiales bacterium]|nr:MaoC family dehydratase N-terminal domain-containing protein [Acidimicrobiales bacterium]
MAVDTSVIGKKTTSSKVVLERGPVSNFAKALKDDNPVYARPEEAREAGFEDIPAPPTFGFAMAHWGAFPETQPQADPEADPQLLAKTMGSLMASGGLVLHGEQEFQYHRTMVVGDVLVGEGRLVDLYEKESKGRTMTFIVMETVYRDDLSGDPVLTTRMNLIHRA